MFDSIDAKRSSYLNRYAPELPSFIETIAMTFVFRGALKKRLGCEMGWLYVCAMARDTRCFSMPAEWSVGEAVTSAHVAALGRSATSAHVAAGAATYADVTDPPPPNPTGQRHIKKAARVSLASKTGLQSCSTIVPRGARQRSAFSTSRTT